MPTYYQVLRMGCQGQLKDLVLAPRAESWCPMLKEAEPIQMSLMIEVIPKCYIHMRIILCV